MFVVIVNHFCLFVFYHKTQAMSSSKQIPQAHSPLIPSSIQVRIVHRIYWLNLVLPSFTVLKLFSQLDWISRGIPDYKGALFRTSWGVPRTSLVITFQVYLRFKKLEHNVRFNRILIIAEFHQVWYNSLNFLCNQSNTMGCSRARINFSKILHESSQFYWSFF